MNPLRALPVALFLVTTASACSDTPRTPFRPTEGIDIDKMLLVPAQFTVLREGTGDLASAAARDPRFYFTRSIAPATRGFSGVGRSTPLRVVRWEVTEDFLVARAAETPGATETLAAYRIQLHFDPDDPQISCTDSTCTARPAARPWFQRRYMRVDWSTNHVTSLPSNLPAPAPATIPSEPEPIFVAASDPRAPRMAPDLGWFEIPERALVHPERVSVRIGETAFDACEVFDQNRLFECGPRDLTMRASFRRIDDAREMTPLLAMGRLEQRFPVLAASDGSSGAVVGARHDLFVRDHVPAVSAFEAAPACNRDEDCATGDLCAIAVTFVDDTHRGRCAHWGVDHASDSHPDPPCQSDAECRFGAASISTTAVCDDSTHTCGDHFFRCRTDDDCASRANGSVCDQRIARLRHDGLGLCTAPLRTRIVEPIAVHESETLSSQLHPAAARAIARWNETLRDAIARARRRECQIEHGIDASDPSSDSEPLCNGPRVTGVDPSSGDAAFVVVGCHSPVWGANDGTHSAGDVERARSLGWDLPACGEPGTTAHDGDLRHVTIESTDIPDEADDTAWMSVSADPGDGRIVASHTVVSMPRVQMLARFVVDESRFLRGELPQQSMILATGWSSGGGSGGRVGDLSGVHVVSDDVVASSLAPWDPTVSGLLGGGADSAEQRFMRSSDLASDIALDPDQSLLVGSLGGNARAAILASPFSGEQAAMQRVRADAEAQHARTECDLRYTPGDLAVDPIRMRYAFESGGFDCDLDPALCIDGPIPAVHDASSDAIERYARDYVATAVLTHEIGHLLGLPHNLAGSADALNYPDRYWEVRGHGHHLGLAPRHLYGADPMDGHYESAEEEAASNDRVSASVMDVVDPYTAVHGPQRGDRAMLASAYTDTLEAFRGVADRDRFEQYAVATTGAGIQTEADFSQFQQRVVHRLHYTQLAALLGEATAGQPQPRAREIDRFVVLARETRPVSVIAWGDVPIALETASGHVLVPYRAASERESRGAWPSVPFDRGGDPYEMVCSLAARWFGGANADNQAPILLTTPFAYASGIRRHYAEPIAATAREMVVADAMLAESSAPGTWPGSDSADWVPRAATVGATNAFLAILMQPDGARLSPQFVPGDTPRYVHDDYGPVGAGIRVRSQRLDGALVAIGSWFDRMVALDGLMANRGVGESIPRRDEIAIDADFGSIFPDASLRWLGGVLADDVVDQSVIIAHSGTQPAITVGVDVATMTRTGEGGDRTHGGAQVPTEPGFTLPMIRLLITHAVARWKHLGPPLFERAARVWSDSDRPAPVDATVSFTDPWSGETYRAFHIGTGADEEGERVGASALVHAETGVVANEAGVAARMLLRLRDLAALRDGAIARSDRANVTRIETSMRNMIERVAALRAAWRIAD